MLTTLSRIIQKFNAAKDLADGLAVVTKEVNSEMNTAACSAFLTDYQQGEHILIAAQGVPPEVARKLRFKIGEGLIGLILDRAEAVNLENALEHPRYVVIPDIKKPPKAFLGVPIIHQRQILGAITVQETKQRFFDEAEEAFLVTLCALLSSSIAQMLATNGMPDIYHAGQPQLMDFSGVAGVSGLSLGKAVVVYPLADLDAVPIRETENIAKELSLFHTGLHSARRDIARLSEGLPETLGSEEKELFQAYLRILDGGSLIKDIEQEIRAGFTAQSSLKTVVKRYVAQFESMDDDYLQERATDIKHLAERVLSHLQETERAEPNYPEQTILIGEEVTPAALVQVPEGRLAGVVSVVGSSNSHVAILARAMGVPTVMGVSGMPLSKIDGKEVIVDGYYGEVYVSPTPEVRAEFQNLIAEEKLFDAELSKLRDLPAQTLDDYVVNLYVNTGLAADIGRALRVGAEGVGLYRTEVPFLLRERFPSEEEQRVIYRQLLAAFAPRPVVMRTLDVGGDKGLAYFSIEEDNPFLGWRGIRMMLDHPEIFLIQIRAMLRAAIGFDNLYVMLPMITNISEVEEAFRLWTQAHDELIAEGEKVTMPEFGAMIEVPASVYQSHVIADRVDFLSVGSNDLTQYILAVDRNNPRVSQLYDGLHPAVIRALIEVVNNAHRFGKKVSICGELAGDPAAVPLLIAIGFDGLSMSAAQLLRVKWVIRHFTMKAARKLLNEVLSMDDPVEIRAHLELALDEAGLGGLIRAGK